MNNNYRFNKSRNPKRIDNFLKEIKKIWLKHPDLRFGQLMINFFAFEESENGDPFYWEEDKFIQRLKSYSEKMRENAFNNTNNEEH